METIHTTKNEFDTMHWFQVCVEKPWDLHNFTVITEAGARRSLVVARHRGPAKASEAWVDRTWRDDQLTLAGNSTRSLATIPLSSVLDSNFVAGVYEVGLYVSPRYHRRPCRISNPFPANFRLRTPFF